MALNNCGGLRLKYHLSFTVEKRKSEEFLSWYGAGADRWLEKPSVETLF
jgi:hypothetical protein